MNHERDQSHAQSSEQSSAGNAELEPGKSSRSAVMRKPDLIVPSGLIQRRARDANGVAEGAGAAVEAASSSSGSPLPETIMRKFEGSLGADLSSVRVHTGEVSVAANDAVGARAYTTGQDIHFGTGQYNPTSGAGEHLLAHEVAHTVQQAGGVQRMQFKLAVSMPDDHLEHEADRAADAMIAGAPAQVSSGAGVARKIFRDDAPDIGTLQGAGDEAATNAAKAPLQVDQVSVTADKSKVHELIADIDKHTPVIQAAEKERPEMEHAYAPLATNTATKTSLSIFNDKLDVSAVDTTAFAVQYRTTYTDYQRLTGEATELLARGKGAAGGDPLAAVGDGFAATSGLKIADGQVGLERFRNARTNLNTASSKMDGQLTVARGAANLLQAAVNSAKAKAAQTSGAEAAKKLAAVRAEIAEMAANVGRVVKIASAVAGLAGGGGATNALATPKESGGHVDIDPSISGLATGGTVLDPQEASKVALIKAMGTDAASVGGSGGGADGMAVALVTAIGNYCNRDKINALQQSIIKAGAEEATFNAAAEAQSMIGYQDQMDGASKQLSLLLRAYASAKAEMTAASEALMHQLSSKGGKTGKNQAKGVLFLSDSDKFLAQVRTAISVGENQQQNLKQAAADRKKLRGTEAITEGGKDQQNQYYFRCAKTVVPGKLWGTNNTYKLEKVFVSFQDNGMTGNNMYNQGGAGTVEGTGGAGDEVANKIATLKKAQEQVTTLQSKVQASIGVGPAGLNA